MTDSVTVVVPTLGRWERLRAALATIRAQRGVDVSAVVVVDRPGLSVPADVTTAARVVVNPGPHGEGAASACGLVHTDTPWVSFCDDDDLWHPDHLVTLLAALHRERREWALGAVLIVDDGLR